MESYSRVLTDDDMIDSKQYGAPGIRNDMLGSSQWVNRKLLTMAYLLT